MGGDVTPPRTTDPAAPHGELANFARLGSPRGWELRKVRERHNDGNGSVVARQLDLPRGRARGACLERTHVMVSQHQGPSRALAKELRGREPGFGGNNGSFPGLGEAGHASTSFAHLMKLDLPEGAVCREVRN